MRNNNFVSHECSINEVYPIAIATIKINQNISNRNIIQKKSQVGLASPLIFLQLRSGNTVLKGLVDTGASTNIINPEILEKTNHRFLFNWEISLKGLGETRAKDWFLLKLEFPNNQFITTPALALPVSNFDLILGLPLLQQLKGIIDLRNNLLTTSLGSFTWFYPKEILVKSSQVFSLTKLESSVKFDELEDIFKDSLLSPFSRKRLEDYMRQKHTVWMRDRVGQAQGISHSIILTCKNPVSCAPRHIPLKFQEKLDEEINKMLDAKVIEPSSSPFRTYPVLVPKPDGSLRVCIDYRKLNNSTVPDRMPLPLIQDLLQATHGSKYFAILDLRAGFWQIPMDEKSKHITAFSTHRGHYQFNVMPFGLINAPSTFQRWISDIFFDLRYNGVLVYMDDILVHAREEQDFVILFEEVIDRLEVHGAQIKISKCSIAPRKIRYLGHCIEDGLRRPDPDRIEPLFRISKPKNVRGVRSLLGMFGFYREYIRCYSNVAKPLTKLTRKGIEFKWGSEQDEALVKLQQLLGNSCLSFSPSGGCFRIETDASDIALGAVLYSKEEFEKGRKIPIMFLSRTLSKSESNWDVSEKEAYAIIWALDRSDSFIRGRDVEVVCDHKNLLWMTNRKRGKVSRWVARLSEYNVEIKYRKGQENVVADFLSRNVEPDPLEVDRAYCFSAHDNDDDFRIVIDVERDEESGVLLEDDKDGNDPIVNLELQEPPEPGEGTLDKLNWLLEGLKLPPIKEIIEKQLVEPPLSWGRGFARVNGRITYLGRIWVPPSLRNALLDAMHLGRLGHFGVRKMVAMITRSFQWEKLHNSINSYIQGCIICQTIKGNYHCDSNLVRSHHVNGAFQTLYLDFWGPITWNLDGKSQLLMTMIDHHTKWAEVVVLKAKTSTEVSKALITHWIAMFGAPSKLITDNEAVLNSAALQRLTTMLGCRHCFSTVYHPQGNAPIESFHRTLKKGLIKMKLQYGNSISLKEGIAWVLLNYRTSLHSSIHMSPAFLTLGFDPIIRSTDCLQGFPAQDDADRVKILLTLRQDIIQRSKIAQQIALLESYTANELKVGMSVLLKLTPREVQRLSNLIGCEKLCWQWSLPMKIEMLNSSKTVAQLRCAATGSCFQAYRDRIRVISEPSSPGLQQLMKLFCQQRETTQQDIMCNPTTITKSSYERKILKRAPDSIEDYSFNSDS